MPRKIQPTGKVNFSFAFLDERQYLNNDESTLAHFKAEISKKG
jgi:hypothetical protein